MNTVQYYSSYLGEIAAAKSIGATYHMGETNTVACHGKDGLSKRHGLRDLLAAVRKGDRVAIAKRDRLSRADLMFGLWCEKEIIVAGGVLLCAEGCNGESPQDEAMRAMMLVFARLECRMIGERTAAALAVKRESGEKTGGPVPFGARISGYRKALRKRGGVLVEVDIPLLEAVPAEQETIAQAREMRAAGMSLRHIGRTLGLGASAERVRRILGRAV